MKITIDKQAQDLRLDKFLRKLLINAPLATIFRLIRTGKVKINNKKRKESYRLQENDVVSFSLKQEEYDAFTKRTVVTSTRKDFQVLFEDEYLLIVNKPASLASQPGTGVETNNLVHQVYHYLHVKPEQLFKPAPVNRLDRGTSGIVIIGKDSETIKKLNSMIKRRHVEKYYLAIVTGTLENKEGKIATYLKRYKENFTDLTKVVDKLEDQAKVAITEYKVLQESKELSLVEIRLKTGRFHQIRAHFAYLKHPILGDPLYGHKEMNVKYKVRNQLLHAYKIKVKHPITKEQLEIIADPPREFEEIKKKVETKTFIK